MSDPTMSDPTMSDLNEFRKQIDVIDEQLVEILARRMNVIRAVASWKQKHGIPAVLPDRVAAVKRNAVRLGEPRGLKQDFLEALYDQIIGEACRVEEAIIAGDGTGD